jgi:hypothetical protein
MSRTGDDAERKKRCGGTSRLRGRGAVPLSRTGDDAERSDEEERCH